MVNLIDTLKNQKEFDLVNRFGKKFYTPDCIAIIAHSIPANHFAHDRINGLLYGMKVSKRYSKKAVIRNKVKRRIRHILHNLSKEHNVAHSAIVVIPKSNFHKKDFAMVQNNLFRIYNISLKKALMV